MIAPPPAAGNNNTKNGNSNKSADSDSDSSDWDSDDDFTTRKISINIKPISQVNNQKISSSVDELRATVGTWKSLANINLVKPNSRRHHQSTVQLENIDTTKSPASEQSKQHQQKQQQQQTNILSPSKGSQFSDVSRVPVAFAVQESLDSRLMPASNNSNSEYLIGHIRMAVPPCLADPLSSFHQQDLEFSLESSIVPYKIQVNGNFVERVNNPNTEMDMSNRSAESYRINMEAVREFARKRSRMESGSKYFLLPELLRYYTHSGPSIRPIAGNGSHHSHQSELDLQVNPINVVSHWLCDLNVTKVRIDISLIDNTPNGFSPLTSDDIKNLKVSLQVNSDVNSHHSKPDANWNPLDSRLTWSFASLTNFIQSSGNDEINSCLARFNLNDGPSTPGSVNVQFSINDKTLTRTRVAVTSPNSFCLAKQKYEVRSRLTEVR